MSSTAYKLFSNRLDQLPNVYPATEEGLEIQILERLYSPEEAELASQLRLTLETPDQIAERLGADPDLLRDQLKRMARRGLIKVGTTDSGLGFGLLPFVVGIYENQLGKLDAEFAQLFESYYLQAFGDILRIGPPIHRVIPVEESVRVDLEIRPYESAATLIRDAKSWGVQDCICRKQKALIGEACEHPREMCMVLHSRPNAFDQAPDIRVLTMEEAMDVLHQAAKAGLVHSVSNNQQGGGYICNCCTCSCGILRGIAELGIANAVARSAFVSQVDEARCTGCEDCLAACQFNALSLDSYVLVDQMRCVGCGLCVQACLEGALFLVNRPESEIVQVPVTEKEWQMQRSQMRGIDIRAVS
jgi:ferredoxin